MFALTRDKDKCKTEQMEVARDFNWDKTDIQEGNTR